MFRKRATRAAKLALVCLTVIVIQSVEISLGKRGGHHRGEPHNKRENDLMLDAFDLDKCGQVSPRIWQGEQSAFGCAHNSSGSQTKDDDDDDDDDEDSEGQRDGRVPLEGEHAKNGEFPFFVSIGLGGYQEFADGGVEKRCAGVLVHSDIVITTGADFIRPKYFPKYQTSVHLRFNSDGLRAWQQLPETKRRASVWCSSKPIGMTAGAPVAADDLAVIRLSEPILYEPGKIQPACLSLDPRGGHSNDATCALAGYCPPAEINITRDYRPNWHPRKILTMPLKRGACPLETGASNTELKIPHETCYRPQNGAGRCRIMQGNSVVCYDKCSKRHPGRVQGHVVGLLSQVGKSGAPDRNPISVIDLHKGRERLMELLRAVRKDWPVWRGFNAKEHNYSDTISCWTLDPSREVF